MAPAPDLVPSPTPRRPDGGPARRLAWLLVGVLVGLSLLVGLPHARPPAPSATEARAEPGTGAGRAADAVADGAPAAQAAIAALVPRRVQPMHRANLAIELGEDLHALAVALLADAEAGDTDAQYALYRIVETCVYEVARFADADALAARRDELMARAGGIHGPAAAALDEERYRMCDGFRRDDLARFGDAGAWLLAAEEAGHPLASVALAAELDRRTPGTLAGDVEAAPLDDAARQARQRELFLTGLASGRPEALWEGFSFDAGESGLIDQWAPAPEGVAWLLLACARGYECSRAARWRRELEAIGGLPPYEDWAEALLFDLPPYQRERALERARELAAALDRGDLEGVLPGALRGGTP